jgi:hypothetical protein
MRTTISLPDNLKEEIKERHLNLSGLIQELLTQYMNNANAVQKEPTATTIHVSKKTIRILKMIRAGQTYDQILYPLLLDKIIHDKNLLRDEDDYFYYLKKDAEPYLEGTMEYTWNELDECFVVKKLLTE